MPRKIFFINHVAKFAADYQANHRSNALQSIEYQQSLPRPTWQTTAQMLRKIFYINHGKVCHGLLGKPQLKCRAKYSMSATWQSLPRLARQIAAQMPRKILNVSYMAKFAAAYQANHCSNAAHDIQYQSHREVLRSLLCELLIKCRAKYSLSTTWQSLPRPTRQTTAHMPRKIFYINHVAKFAAAYQANHRSNAPQSIEY
jgi:hypothetical protein